MRELLLKKLWMAARYLGFYRCHRCEKHWLYVSLVAVFCEHCGEFPEGHLAQCALRPEHYGDCAGANIR